MGSASRERWVVDAVDEFTTWLASLDRNSQEKVVALRRLLAQHGRTLGRPYADRIKGARHHTLKELRPSSSESEALRILFYFDPEREGLLLVGGDEAGEWDTRYDENIPIADDRIDRHEAALKANADAKKTRSKRRKQR